MNMVTKMLRILSLTIVLLTLSSGCATTIRGSKDVFAIETDPQGVSAHLSNGFKCITPCAVELPRKYGFSVKLEKEGYQSVTTNVVPRSSGAGSGGVLGNILLGGLIGLAVDSSTGAGKDLYPNPLVVKMEKISSDLKSSVIQSETDTSESTKGITDNEKP